MTLDDIAADKTMVLTAEMDRLFKAAGCEPACHVCDRDLELGDSFALVSVENEDHMVCSSCGKPALKRQVRARRKAEAADRLYQEEWEAKHPGKQFGRPGAGYSRPSKIIR